MVKKRKIKRFLIALFLLVVFVFAWNSLTDNATVIYISSHKKEMTQDVVVFYVDGKIIDTLSLKKHYDLNLHKSKHNFSFGKHLIELKTLDNKTYLKETFYNYGFTYWIVISCYEDSNYTFISFFNEPKLL